MSLPRMVDSPVNAASPITEPGAARRLPATEAITATPVPTIHFVCGASS